MTEQKQARNGQKGVGSPEAKPGKQGQIELTEEELGKASGGLNPQPLPPKLRP
jgi:hypothetical protein